MEEVAHAVNENHARLLPEVATQESRSQFLLAWGTREKYPMLLAAEIEKPFLIPKRPHHLLHERRCSWVVGCVDEVVLRPNPGHPIFHVKPDAEGQFEPRVDLRHEPGDILLQPAIFTPIH